MRTDSFRTETSEADVANLNASLTHEHVLKTLLKKTQQKTQRNSRQTGETHKSATAANY